MKKKHAYLIMAHHKINNLTKLVEALDNKYNDIFIHLDVKCKDKFNYKPKYSKLYFIERESINWGGATQINCELALLKAAVNNYNYHYYHLLTGVSFPIKSQEYIHSFFDKNDGYEFVGFDNAKDYSERVKYVFLFNEIGKTNTFFKKLLSFIRRIYLKVQKILKINRFKKFNIICKKGFVYWSITDAFAKYVVSNENLINEMLKYSLCGDEIFIQTLLYNSKFKDKIYNYNDEFKGSLRICPWGSSEVGYREGYNFNTDDVDFLINSPYLFALKFEGDDGIDVIDRIKKGIKKNEYK